MDAPSRKSKIGPKALSSYLLPLRVLAFWLLATSVYWWYNDLLFNDLLANVRIPAFGSPERHKVIGLSSDILLILAILALFFKKTARIAGIVLFLLLPGLYLFMTVNGSANATAPVAIPLSLLFVPSTQKGFGRLFKVIRIISICGLLLWSWLLLTQKNMIEFAYLSTFISPSWIYLFYIPVAVGLFTTKWDLIILLLLMCFVLIHSLIYHHPALPATLIFAPFLNWTNLHRSEKDTR